jgi:UDP-glucose 4-epimerase
VSQLRRNETILVTGGTGYIGSHTILELLAAGYDVVALDNLVNSHAEVLERLARIAGQPIEFVQGDVRDAALLATLFAQRPIHAVIHFAALKAVGESNARPLDYYDNNVYGSLCLLRAMQAAGVKTFVFSSSATVYGAPDQVPIDEEAALRPTNPYGQTKLAVERILQDLAASEPGWRIATLRYFNPVGAHASGLIGELPQGVPNNLMPYITQVAIGQRPQLNVYGSDYDTPDGTGVRDYIHVVDLARGHVAALQALEARNESLTVNLGTGRGYSVLDVVRAFEAASGRAVALRFAERRAGDIGQCYAATAKAEALLGWRAERSLEQMCEDSWRWQSLNPRGYRA